MTKHRGRAFHAIVVLLIALLSPSTPSVAADLSTVFSENFNDGLANGWTMANPTLPTADPDTALFEVDHDLQPQTYRSHGIGMTDIAVYNGATWATDFTYRARIDNGYGAGGNMAGVVFNYQDENNYYLVRIAHTTPPTATLETVRNGSPTPLATNNSYSGGGQNVWFDLEVVRSGDTTTVKVNGVPIFSNIPQTGLGAGKIGLMTRFAYTWFDDVAVLTTGFRDPLKWPFAATSIWNMPIGSNAAYVNADLPPVPPIVNPNDGNDPYWLGMPGVEFNIIVLTPAAPLNDIWFNSAAWQGLDRCNPQQNDPHTLLFQLPMPSSFVVPNCELPPDGTSCGQGNNSAIFLQPNARTLVSTQPFVRCVAGGPGTTLTPDFAFPNADLYGDGIAGSHGGSGLSSLGGVIRLGELKPGQQGPRHALSVSFWSLQAYYRCYLTNMNDCYRWPADRADSYAADEMGYGSVRSGPPAMKMGALLAIPASVDLSTLGLQTEPGKQLAWTLKNYGAYINDSAGEQTYTINIEQSPNGKLDAQFLADWGFNMPKRWGHPGNVITPWSRDIERLMLALHVVDNNTVNSIGGGGTPRQPLAPPLPPPPP